MPESSSSDIPHVTINDHKIAVHNKKVNDIKGDFIGLVALNNEKPDNLTKAKDIFNIRKNIIGCIFIG